jgi:hypothetical protein
MTETQEHGAPFFFATMSRRRRPRSTIYLTVTTAVPDFPGKVEAIDIVLSVGIRQGGHRRAFDRRHRGAPERAAMIGFTPLRPRLRA